MRYPISYHFISQQIYEVRLRGQFIGEVRFVRGAWYFQSFTDPNFVSSVPSGNRFGAVVQWPGLSALLDDR